MARVTRTLGRNNNTMPFSVSIPQKWWTRTADQPGSGERFTRGCFAHEQLQTILTADLNCIDGWCNGGWVLTTNFISEQDCYEDPQKQNLTGDNSFTSSGEGSSDIIVLDDGRGVFGEHQTYNGSIKLTHTYHVGPCRGGTDCSALGGPPNDDPWAGCKDKFRDLGVSSGGFMGVPLGELAGSMADTTVFNAPACLPVGDGTKVCAGSKDTDWLDIFDLLETNSQYTDSGGGPLAALHNSYSFMMQSWNAGYTGTQWWAEWNWMCPAPRLNGDGCMDDWRNGWINESSRLNSCC